MCFSTHWPVSPTPPGLNGIGCPTSSRFPCRLSLSTAGGGIFLFSAGLKPEGLCTGYGLLTHVLLLTGSKRALE